MSSRRNGFAGANPRGQRAIMSLNKHRTFMSRLARDVRGNTIAIMAVAMIPLIGFVGSAIDFARIYVVKVRLQQACDAGVLAGRKAMTDTQIGTPLETKARDQANAFFFNNFRTGWYQTSNLVFTPTKTSDSVTSTTANIVQATASVTLPMTLMKFFGVGTRDFITTCQARYDLADTDVMFVLDTTGSMSCYPSDPANCANGPTTPFTRDDNTTGYYNPEKPAHTLTDGTTEYSKIESLRRAVILFDSTMRANADPTTHFRYGFVPYSSAVNVGGIIPAGYVQSGTYSYDSRHLNGDYSYGSPSSVSLSYIPLSYCVEQRNPATGYSRTGPTWGDAGYYQAMRYYNLSWSAANGGTCSGMQQPLRAMWRYEPTSVDIGGYAASLANNTPVTVPGRLDGLTSKWRGCIEEVNSSPDASFSVSSLPHDLDPDWKPTTATDKWRPLWPEVEWLRNPGTTSQDINDDAVDENRPAPGASYYWTDVTFRGGMYYDRSGSVTCGRAAQRLTDMTASSQAQTVRNYVYDNDFKPAGGTYHDVGMIWGTRMMSPDGVFAGDTAPWPGRNAPTRNIVFMTDGTMAPSLTSYGQYGVEAWDNRVTAGDWNNQMNRHNARFRIECDAAKKKGMTIYVVAVGVPANADLTYCASPGQTFQASSTDQLTTAFKSIAQRVAMLRITL